MTEKWKPIETAPENESFYAAAKNPARYFLGSIKAAVFISACGNIPPIPPTHWMPLPPPPET
jgi:hypothetical protein